MAETTTYGNLNLTGKFYIKNQHRMVEAVCSCGVIKYYFHSNLKRGNTTSCGCNQKKIVATVNFKHGLTPRSGNHALYNVYNGLKERCYNQKHKSFINYGGRGIGVCQEWLESFMSFYNWAVNNGWSKGLTIDRINNNGNYEPLNCRFVTVAEQNRNKRNSFNIFAFGETKCLQDWANDKRCVMSLNGLWLRIKKGWASEEAILTPSMNKKAA